MSVPMYMEIPAECAADALLERDGALRPLALSFDPRDVRASASADRPGEAEARAVEAVARAARAIVAAIEPIVAALDAVAAVQPIVDVVSPVVEAVSAVTATPRARWRRPTVEDVVFGTPEERASLATDPPPSPRTCAASIRSPPRRPRFGSMARGRAGAPICGRTPTPCGGRVPESSEPPLRRRRRRP